MVSVNQSWIDHGLMDQWIVQLTWILLLWTTISSGNSDSSGLMLNTLGCEGPGTSEVTMKIYAFRSCHQNAPTIPVFVSPKILKHSLALLGPQRVSKLVHFLTFKEAQKHLNLLAFLFPKIAQPHRVGIQY